MSDIDKPRKQLLAGCAVYFCSGEHNVSNSPVGFVELQCYGE